MLFVPAPMFLIDHPAVIARVKMQCVNQIAVRQFVSGLKPHALPIGGDRFINLPNLLQYIAKNRVSLSEIRLETNGLSKGSDGLIKLLLAIQSISEIAVCFGKIGFKSNSLP